MISAESCVMLTAHLKRMQRIAKFQLFAFFTLLFVLCAILLRIDHLGAARADLRLILIWSVIATVFAIVYGALAVAFYINRVTQGLFQAIVLLAKN